MRTVSASLEPPREACVGQFICVFYRAVSRIERRSRQRREGAPDIQNERLAFDLHGAEPAIIRQS